MLIEWVQGCSTTVFISLHVRIDDLAGKLDKASYHLVLLLCNVQDDIELINNIAYLPLELSLGRDVQEGQNERWVYLVFDTGLIYTCEVLR